MNRIYHTWDKWECFPAGFYDNKAPMGLSKDEAEELYASFLSNLDLFESSLKIVISEWKHSCEHYLTNENMNRIAWLGQACAAQSMGIPSCFRAGFSQLSEDQKNSANRLALKYLNIWLKRNDYEEVDSEGSGINLTVNKY